jgi:C-terminal processing protease CtpA/Prc
MRFFIYIFIVFLLILQSQHMLSADTVYLNDGGEIKGIVVENYHSWIVLSTFEGEKEIEKTEIKDIIYDRREQNLIKLGDYHQEKGNTTKAYSYYKKAYELNPGHKEARDKYVYTRSVLVRGPDRQFKSDMDRKRALFKEAGKVYDPIIRDKILTPEARLKESTGLVIFLDEHMPRISTIMPFSAAEKSGLKQGDVIFSLWGKLTGYLDLDSIIGMMIYSQSPEIILSVKRRIALAHLKSQGSSLSHIGISIDLQEDGLVVKDIRNGSDAALCGLLQGDIVTDINDQSTRYMPLKTAIAKIEEAFASNNLQLDILRNTSLWRKEG